MNIAPSRIVWICKNKACKWVKAFEGKSLEKFSQCPECNCSVKWHWIEAYEITDHKCDSRCTHARSKVCDCACGGKNHGIHFLG